MLETFAPGAIHRNDWISTSAVQLCHAIARLERRNADISYHMTARLNHVVVKYDLSMFSTRVEFQSRKFTMGLPRRRIHEMNLTLIHRDHDRFTPKVNLFRV